MQTLIGKLSMQSHVEELAIDDGIHAAKVAQSEPRPCGASFSWRDRALSTTDVSGNSPSVCPKSPPRRVVPLGVLASVFAL